MPTLKQLENELRNLKRQLLNAENNNRNNRNSTNTNYSKNKNVAVWMNREMSPGNKTNIKPSNRAYLKTNVSKNGKILHVYDREGLKNYLAFANQHGSNAVRPSPMTRRPFKLSNVMTYPPKTKGRRGKKRKMVNKSNTPRKNVKR